MKSKPDWIIIRNSTNIRAVVDKISRTRLGTPRNRRFGICRSCCLEGIERRADISGKVVELLNLDSLDSGVVAFVEIDDLEKRNEWESQDSKIQRVSFHEEIPEYLYWGTNELKSILDHWSASRTTGS